MSVEISTDGLHINLENKSKENRSADGNQTAGDGRAVLNGISNGYGDKIEHKSENKDKHREPDKHHKDHRDRDKNKEKHKEKERDRSSSGKERDRHSSGSSKDKDKDRDKKSKDERKDKERSRDHKSSSSSKDHKSSSSSKDKDRHSSSNSSKDKEKHSSSSSSKDKEKHSSSSSSKDKHNSSSSSKDKHGLSSEKKHGDRDKHRDKSKEKSKPSSETRKDKDITKEDVKVKLIVDASPVKREPEIIVKREPDVIVKRETVTPVKQEPHKKDADDEVDEGCNNSFTLSRSIKTEDDGEEDVPLSARTSIGKVKRLFNSSGDEDDDIPLSARKRVKKEKIPKKRKQESEDESEFKPEKKKKAAKKGRNVKIEPATQVSPRKKKEEEQQEVWKWWEEEKKDDGKKWNFLEHKGPVFAPIYERLPSDVKFSYNGKEMKLSEGAEEVATFYARMLDHDYTTKEAFNKNFMKDWRKMMTSEEREKITDLSKCNFKHMLAYFVSKTEERKAMSKEQKKKIKEDNEALAKEYGFCTFDGHKEKIGNFKIEPPGLFRGRGEHPKMGMLKKRLQPEDIIINCSKNSKTPKAPDGHRWREVRHDQNVTWLASWTENVQGQVKYIMLNPSSKLKGEKDWQKYEMARQLNKSIGKIREEYRNGWKSKEMRIRQRAVALYFIDKLALRAGNEKDEDQADTVGCCSLRVEHISLQDHKDGKDNVVVFDFLGKDSIRYYNEVSVEKRVYKNVQLFMENKNGADDLFDRLTTTVLNKHLNELMEGLSAKVFRTYNASHTLQDQLDRLTDPKFSVQEKILAYNRANRAVAILCNHQRAVPKTHAKSMGNMMTKIETKKDQLKDAERQYKDAKSESKNHGSAKNKIDMDKRKKALDRIKEQLAKMELQATDKEENKEISLGTSKLNYLDPRISVAWCKKHDVPIEKIYNKTQRDKFRWAIDMAGPDYVF